jgi:FMN phosphatase YigB (HAD superfamily)
VTPLRGIEAVTFDFGNTLVRADRAGLRSVVDTTTGELLRGGTIDDGPAFLEAWAVERDRQFRIQVPRLLEVDLTERVRHVLAAVRGVPAPRADTEAWDAAAVARVVDSEEVAVAVETYSEAFVSTIVPLDDATAVLRTAHGAGVRLGILSNWPLARTIDRYVATRGWDSYLDAVVVSQRVGVIKPHPAIFAAAASALAATPPALLHVGDDWAADVVGARRAGWRAAYLRGQQGDTPLPTSHPDGEVSADVEVDRLMDLLPHLARGPSGSAGQRP